MLLNYLEPVPFAFDNEAHLGLSETRGLLSCEGRNLVIEFQVADAIFGALKGETKRIEIPLQEVIRVEFRARFFGLYNRLTLVTRNQDLLQMLPEAKQGRIKTTIRRRDRTIAEEFSLEITTAIQRIRGEQMAIDLDRMELE